MKGNSITCASYNCFRCKYYIKTGKLFKNTPLEGNIYNCKFNKNERIITWRNGLPYCNKFSKKEGKVRKGRFKNWEKEFDEEGGIFYRVVTTLPPHPISGRIGINSIKDELKSFINQLLKKVK